DRSWPSHHDEGAGGKRARSSRAPGEQRVSGRTTGDYLGGAAGGASAPPLPSPSPSASGFAVSPPVAGVVAVGVAIGAALSGLAAAFEWLQPTTANETVRAATARTALIFDM